MSDLFAAAQPQTDPTTFDFEGWLQGAHLPEESATVYQRPDVMAELSDLKRRITQEAQANTAAGEYTAADPELTPLEQEYLALLQTFSKSALTVYVRALTEQELRDLRTASEARTKDLTADEQNADYGYSILAASITAVKPAGGDRQPVIFTPDKVRAMYNALGSPQMTAILNARLTAQNAAPTVDADFLHKRSGTEAGAE